MQFSGETNGLDLYTDYREWCGIETNDTTTSPIAEFARKGNFALDKIVPVILRYDNVWEWDDFNNTTLPIGETDLVDGQNDYGLSTTQLKIKRVRVLDAQGEYHVINHKNRRDLTDDELNANDGLPTTYDLIGNSIVLNPAPAAASVTTTDGLELQVQAGASHFAVTDTTKEPGFAAEFHRLVSMMAAQDYCDQNDLEKRSMKLRDLIGRAPSEDGRDEGTGMLKELALYYSSRAADAKFNIKPKREDYGAGILIN